MDAYAGAFAGRSDFAALGFESPNQYVEAMSGELISSLFDWYRQRTGKRMLADKITPYLGTSALVVARLREYFPRARRVFLLRDPRDVLTSGVFRWLSREPNDSARRRQALDGCADVGIERFFTDEEIDRWARYWQEPLDGVRATGETWLEVRYEEMLQHTGPALARLFRHLGVAADEKIVQECVERSRFEVMSGGRKPGVEVAAAHVRKGIAGDWRRWMTRRDGELISDLLGGRLKELGYERDDSWIAHLPRTLGVNRLEAVSARKDEVTPVGAAPPQHRALNRTEMEIVAGALRRTCALGRVLDVSCGAGDLVRHLLDLGVDVFGVDVDSAAVAISESCFPGRCGVIRNLVLPFANKSFDTVVGTDGLLALSDDECDQFLNEIRRVVRRHVYLRLSASTEPREALTPIRDRGWWEKRFLRAGFRRHPALLRVADYAALEDERNGTVLLERISEEVLRSHPLEKLQAERDLHTDMLRESGRRSDAHLQRYEFASSWIRPNDVVVDVACGLGYGVAVMASAGRASRFVGVDNSSYAIGYARAVYGECVPAVQFQEGDAHTLAELKDNSVHLVVSFETIEHLNDPALFLSNVTRVLAPGGRFIGSVPNAWIDEKGHDPNPHHLHVFDAQRLLKLFGRPFLTEGLYAQTAGGGMKLLPEPVRAWRRVDPVRADAVSAEWWIVVAMKDPQTGANVPYTETVFPPGADGFQPASLSFAEAYRNPWVRHPLVSRGIRITDSKLLDDFARSVEADFVDDGVERAAALCVRGYQKLEAAHVRREDVWPLLERITEWLSGAGTSRHHFRWLVSLEFLAGRSCLATGSRDEALRWFQRCAARDARQFSPLLATKTVEAAYLAGLIFAHDRKHDDARRIWGEGLRAAGAACSSDWREVIGDEYSPATFGPRELAQVMDFAVCCAAGLKALPTWEFAPGRMAEIIAGDSRSAQLRASEVQRSFELASLERLAAENNACRRKFEADLAALSEVSRAQEAAFAATRDRVRRVSALETTIQLVIRGSVVSAPRGELVVWGTGSGGRRVRALVNARGGRVGLFIDSDPGKTGTTIDGVRIGAPAELSAPEWKGALVLLASVHVEAISARFRAAGLERSAVLVPIDFDALPALEEDLANQAANQPR